MQKQQTEKQTLVEDGTEFQGTMKSSCPVTVRGKFDGELIAPALTVTESGVLVGNVKAEKIRSNGVLAGSMDADDIYLAGTVRSDTVIRAKTLEVRLAPEKGKLEVTFGECVIDVGDEPTVDASPHDDEHDEDDDDSPVVGRGNGHADSMLSAATEASEPAE